MSVFNSQTINEAIRFACDANDVPELTKRIYWEWNNRFTSRMGDARKTRIRLSRPLWPRATEQERYETVIHEACHIIADYKYKRATGHGPLWAGTMRVCGVKAERCHGVDTKGFRKARSKVKAVCGCKTWELGTTRATRIKLGTRVYTCPHCRQKLTLA